MRVALNGQSQTSADTSRQTATEVNVIYFTIVISKGQLAIAKLKLLSLLISLDFNMFKCFIKHY